MPSARVMLCVGFAAASAGLSGFVVGCESTKAPKGEAPKAEAIQAPEVESSPEMAKDAAKAGQPAIANVPPSDPLAMQKLREAAAAALADEEDYSLAAVFPEPYLPVTDFPDKAQRRIRYRLRDAAKAPIALRTLIPVVKPDGSAEVFGLYEYSRYEDCVKGYPTRKAGKNQCRQHLVTGGCVALGLLHAKFGAPRPGETIETSGSLDVWWSAIDDSDCSVSSDEAFVDDLDRDGKLEMALDLETEYLEPDERQGYPYRKRREFFVFQGTDDALINLSYPLDSIFKTQGEASRSADYAAKIEARDANGDGKLDFVFTEVPECADKLLSGGHAEEAAECARTPRTKTVFLRARVGDAWARSEEVSAAWTAEEAKRVEESLAAERQEAAAEAPAAGDAAEVGDGTSGPAEEKEEEGKKEEGKPAPQADAAKPAAQVEAKSDAKETKSEAKSDAKAETPSPAAAPATKGAAPGAPPPAAAGAAKTK